MAPHSPLAWLLVDRRLRRLEPPKGLELAGYYSTVGDGPKLPGSQVTFRGTLGPAEALTWARSKVQELGFRQAEDCRPTECFFEGAGESAWIRVGEDSGRVGVSVFISPRN